MSRLDKLAIERLRTCYRCQGNDVTPIAMSDNGTDIVFSAWCEYCDKPFGYRVRVENVTDKKGRI